MTADADLLLTWEIGQALPADARLLYLAGAGADDMAVGAAAAALLARHRALFGPLLQGVTDCPDCSAKLDVACDIDALLGAHTSPGAEHEVVLDDGARVRFRLPTHADLAALGDAKDEDTAALLLLGRCLVGTAASAALVAPIAARMAELDPLGDPELRLDCAACGSRFSRPLDPAAFLWQEMSIRAKRLLGQVAALARAYGWREADILSMSAVRRQAYLDLAEAG